ncbi:MAG: tetratricopeptide repeat protein, partial [Desulfobacteraceae bacterium]|nr:tetratricopeptide repeat protein [Desulfobacteraceae bacterium]
RLMFSGKLDKAEHLSRQYLADLILDTRIYTGHTTTSDALWAGVPVVTLEGGHFASRVSSSILQAIGLPELITHTLDEFESLAIKLAQNPELLNQIRQKIAKNRLTEPLFDTPRFVRNLEQGYREMWELFVAGQSPRQIEVIEKAHISPVGTAHNSPEIYFREFNIETALKQAFELHQAGKFAEAKIIYDKILDKYPSHADTLHLRGVLAHQTDDNEKAIALIREAIRLAPNNASYYSNLGAALQVSDRYDEAIEVYRKAVELSPTHIEAWLNMGGVLKILKKYEDAISCLQKVLDIQPNHPEAYSSLGLSYRALGNKEMAMSCFPKSS